MLRQFLLATAGLLFLAYSSWQSAFTVILVGSGAYVGARHLARLRASHANTRAPLRLWIALTLVPLVLTKYADSIGPLAASAFGQVFRVIPAPLGVSFYTFNAVALLVATAAGRTQGPASPWAYASYFLFFPQLASGPLTRYRDLAGGFERLDGAPGADGMASALGLFAVGLVKKAILADTIARLDAPLLASPSDLLPSAAWIAAFAFSLELYFDFSGYTDMAMGAASFFGIALPRNFDSPYQAVDVRDFWRRWHMTLSYWLRDHVFLPLSYAMCRRLGDRAIGGVRGEYWAYAGATLGTMVLCGLWHGARWTYVLWGVYFGVLLSVEQAMARPLRRVPRPFRRMATFLVVLVGWVMFRSPTVGAALGWYTAMVGVGGGSLGAPPTLTLVVALCGVAALFFPDPATVRFRARRWTAILLAVMVFVAYLFVNEGGSAFIYYQF